MKRYFSILSLLFVLASTVHGQTPATPQRQAEKLDKQQLSTLIAYAKTPEEHLRIAQFYNQEAQDFLAQAQEHEAMLAVYKADSSLSTNKNYASTIGHCEYLVKRFHQMAAKSQEVAHQQEQMAYDAAHLANVAEHPVPSSRLGK